MSNPRAHLFSPLSCMPRRPWRPSCRKFIFRGITMIKISISMMFVFILLFNFAAHPHMAMRQMLSYWLRSSNISIVLTIAK